MGFQYEDLDDEEDDILEDEEMGISSDGPPANAPGNVAPIQGAKKQLQQEKQGRRLRVRNMPQKMATKMADVVSIMITRNDGRQLMFVRR